MKERLKPLVCGMSTISGRRASLSRQVNEEEAGRRGNTWSSNTRSRKSSRGFRESTADTVPPDGMPSIPRADGRAGGSSCLGPTLEVGKQETESRPGRRQAHGRLWSVVQWKLETKLVVSGGRRSSAAGRTVWSAPEAPRQSRSSLRGVMRTILGIVGFCFRWCFVMCESARTLEMAGRLGKSHLCSWQNVSSMVQQPGYARGFAI